MLTWTLTIVGLLLCFFQGFAFAKSPLNSKPVQTWFPQQVAASQNFLLKNISPTDGFPGSVIASPSRANPNYYFHWIRDAALVMETVRHLEQKYEARTPFPLLASQRNPFDQILRDYTAFSRLNQITQTLTGLGEPKYYVDGSAFSDAWGRPQNDGPALRAVTLGQWALELIARGDLTYVKNWLYRAELPARTVVKADLEYVSHHWQQPSFDLWEEVLADHFYTLMVQRKALVIGSQLAQKMNDPKAAEWYTKQAQLISVKLEKFWNQEKQIILTSLNYAGGLDSKKSNLDIAVLLAVLHGQIDGYSFSVQDPRVEKTVSQLISVFAKHYPINVNNPQYAPAIGRYTEDVYSGNGFDGGNPWFLTTLAVAEFYFLKAGSSRNFNQKLFFRNLGTRFLERVQLHSHPDYHLSEQIDRTHGAMIGAEDLTWSHSAILTTHFANQSF